MSIPSLQLPFKVPLSRSKTFLFCLESFHFVNNLLEPSLIQSEGCLDFPAGPDEALKGVSSILSLSLGELCRLLRAGSGMAGGGGGARWGTS